MSNAVGRALRWGGMGTSADDSEQDAGWELILSGP